MDLNDRFRGKPSLSILNGIANEIALSGFVSVADLAMYVPGLARPVYLEITIEQKRIFEKIQDGMREDGIANSQH